MNSVCINISAFVSDSDTNKKRDVLTCVLQKKSRSVRKIPQVVIHSILFGRFMHEFKQKNYFRQQQIYFESFERFALNLLRKRVADNGGFIIFNANN